MLNSCTPMPWKRKGCKRPRGEPYRTPISAVKLVVHLIPSSSRIWDPFSKGDSQNEIKTFLENSGHTVVRTETDFLTTTPPEGTTFILSCPQPFGKRTLFL